MMKILIIDDDEATCETFADALSSEGHQVRTALNGRAALEILHDFGAELILLDLVMPVMDGPAFAQAYQTLPGSHAPIIVFTAAAHPEEQTREMGADGLLAKPFFLDELLDVLGHYVTTKSILHA
jgi:two-component system, chemotaxis family, chemotaxis protein CheY